MQLQLLINIKIFFAAGVHPYEIDNYDEKILRQYLCDEKCVAVGECGLDYFRFKSDLAEEIQKEKENQKRFLSHSLNLLLNLKNLLSFTQEKQIMILMRFYMGILRIL